MSAELSCPSRSDRPDGDKTATLTLNFLDITTGTKTKFDIDHTKRMKAQPAVKLTQDI